MKHFSLKRIIEVYSLDPLVIAKVLFPNAKHPKPAFDRVLKGNANLDTDQLQLLASHIGVLPADLFSINNWKSGTEGGCMTLTKDEYKVKLNYNGTFLTIFKNEQVVKQEIVGSITMSITELIKHIDNLITNI